MTPNDANRRTFLKQSGVGLGSAALSSLISGDTVGAPSANSVNAGARADVPHLPPRVKRVIFLCMAGGPSHLETFDYKPKLDELNGKPMPASYTDGQPIAQLQGQTLMCQGHLTKFSQYGKSGQWISDFLPWHQKMADDICVIRSLHTEQINHDPAHTFMNTGTAISGRPSMGSWVTYGLGSESAEPAWIRRDDQRWRPQSTTDRLAAMGFRISAQPIPRRRIQQHRPTR